MANKEVFPDGKKQEDESAEEPALIFREVPEEPASEQKQAPDKPRQLGFLQAIWRALIYTPCDHDWEVKVDKVIAPMMEHAINVEVSGYAMKLLQRRHVLTLACRRCGKLFHRDTAES